LQPAQPQPWRQRLISTSSRYSRLPVTSCIVDSAAIYIMVVKFRNTTTWPPSTAVLPS
jgi:hypothetical protein